MNNDPRKWEAFSRAVKACLLLPAPGRPLKVTELASDERAFQHLIATVAMEANNKIRSDYGASISFSDKNYVGTGESVVALRRYRDGAISAGLIGWTKGFHSHHELGHSFAGRIRPTERFKQLLEHHGVGDADIPGRPSPIIVMRGGPKSPGDEPECVTQSRRTIAAFNQMISGVELELPDEEWTKLRQAEEKAYPEDVPKLHAAGNTQAKGLYRVFSGDWEAGGRLYGGWWQLLPKAQRRKLLISGAPAVELDYSQIHPTILYRMKGATLEGDAYLMGGYPQTLEFREFGKRTFNRLLNKRTAHPLQFQQEDRRIIQKEDNFRKYVRDFLQKHAAVEDQLYRSAGLRLQFKDSELALKILSDFTASPKPIYPIHDSFMVLKRDENALRCIMESAFHASFGVYPCIR